MIEQELDEHDAQHPTVIHQAMILTQTKTTRNAALDIADVYERLFPDHCKVYVSPDVTTLEPTPSVFALGAAPAAVIVATPDAEESSEPTRSEAPPSTILPPPSLRVTTTNDFVKGKFRTLVVVGRLIEGFDHAPVSVVCIARNVGLESRVLFSQFVGRAVRKAPGEDPPLKAKLITHYKYNQKDNFSFWYDPDTLKNDAEINGE